LNPEDLLAQLGLEIRERVCESCPGGREAFEVCVLCEIEVRRCRCSAFSLRQFVRLTLEARDLRALPSLHDPDVDPPIWEL